MQAGKNSTKIEQDAGRQEGRKEARDDASVRQRERRRETNREGDYVCPCPKRIMR